MSLMFAVTARRLLVVALAVVLLALTEAGAHAAFPGANGKIAFMADTADNPGADYGVWTMGPDGSNAIQLTHQGPVRYDIAPAWSADGSRIAFIWDYDVWTMNSDGGNRLKLTDAASDPIGRRNFDPAWSPDGSSIAFIKGGALWVMNADGSQQRRVTPEDPYGEGGPNWSPDGSKIAFTRVLGGQSDIYTIHPDGTGLSNVTATERSEVSPNWSPDGSQIAFVVTPGNIESGVNVMNADGTGRRFLTSGASPAWSPDGTSITFSDSGIYTILSDGTGRTFLHRGADPDWQPIVGPRRSGYKNAAHFCKAEREFFGEDAFRERYGGGANAHGKCVSRN